MRKKIRRQPKTGGRRILEFKPNSDISIRAITNMSPAIFTLTHPPKWLPNCQLITDFYTQDPNKEDAYKNAVGVLSTSQYALINFYGQYKSGRRVDGVGVGRPHDRYPQAAVDENSIPAEYMGWDVNPDWVNITIPAARVRFVQEIINLVSALPTPYVLLDNMAHPSVLSSGFPWVDTCTFLLLLKQALNARNIKLIANVAGGTYAWSTADLQLFISCVDGYTAEQPFHENAQATAALTAKQLNDYRIMCNHGLIVCMLATDAATGLFYAGVTMCARLPGNSIFVSYPGHLDAVSWFFWPRECGPALGDFVISGTNITRQFRGGTITVDMTNNTASLG